MIRFVPGIRAAAAAMPKIQQQPDRVLSKKKYIRTTKMEITASKLPFALNGEEVLSLPGSLYGECYLYSS